jgi:hypothetical protein
VHSRSSLFNGKFTITVHGRKSSFKEAQTIMAQSNRENTFELVGAGNPLRRSETACGAVVLSLVHQAAELFSEIEEQAHGAETRAASLLQRLRSAEARTEAVEQSLREIFVEADSKLEAASRALDRAEREIIAARDKAAAAEARAELAEVKAREALETLAVAEQVIRKQLLSRAAATGSAVSGEVSEPQGTGWANSDAPASVKAEKGAVLVQSEPTLRDGGIKPSVVLARRAAQLEDERDVDALNVDRLEGVGELESIGLGLLQSCLAADQIRPKLTPRKCPPIEVP